MSADAWFALETDETVVWDASPRLMRAVPAVLASLAIAIVGLGGAAVSEPALLAALLVAPFPAAYGYLRVVTTRFVLTDRALYRKRGVLGIDVRTVEFGNVQNTRTRQNFLGTLFDYGTLEIEVAGGRDLRFYDVYDPDGVRRLVDLEGADVVPGTVEQWRAIRDELREIRRAAESRSA